MQQSKVTKHKPIQSEPIHWILWYKNLNFYDKTTARNEIIRQCMLKDAQTFYNWLYSYIPVPPLSENIIQNIAGVKVDFTFTARAGSYHHLKSISK